MWLWMNKAVRIGTNQGTFLVWILDYCCLDHDDVTWDGSKGESFREQGGERRRWNKGFYRIVGWVGGTCSKKP